MINEQLVFENRCTTYVIIGQHFWNKQTKVWDALKIVNQNKLVNYFKTFEWIYEILWQKFTNFEKTWIKIL